MKLLHLLRLAAFGLVAVFGASCSSLPEPVQVVHQPDPEVVRLKVLVTPTAKKVIPPNTRIVVANITGRFHNQPDPCADAVKDALMRRLIENADYDVLARDDLDWIFKEMETTWGGRFNTHTAAQMGELLGASLFVVGRVAYCGMTANNAPDSESPVQFSIYATIQIIDLATGRVVVSSAGDGNFVPQSSRLATLLKLPVEEEESKEEPTTPEPLPETAMGKAQEWLKSILPNDPRGALRSLSLQDAATAAAEEPDRETKAEQYQLFRAAEDLANGFADNFFARPVWQTVEMWRNEQWTHSEALYLVKLGDCPKAMELMAGAAADEISSMDQSQMAQYLHNYGVVLLCANHPDRAVDKLRSAYRLGYNKTTLRMLGLARMAQEWALRAEDDVQPEVDLLINQSALWGHGE